MAKEDVKGRMFSSAAWVAAGSVIAKLLGALYRVPLTNILGAKGMGMYQLVFPVFALCMAFSTAGIPTALARIVAEKRALREPSKKYLASALILLGALGTLLAIVIFSLSQFIAEWQGNPSTVGGYRIIAPTLILVGLIAGFRGYFQGEMYMLPTAISNIIEQIVKLAVGIGLSAALIRRGVAEAVEGALFGVLASEVVALIYLLITYLVRSRKTQRERIVIKRDDAREMFKIAFPIAVVSILLPLSSFFDSLITVNMLRLKGLDLEVATAQYGLLSGPVNSLVNMPIALIMSLAVAAVPAVSVSRVRRDIDGVMLKSRLSVKIAYLVGVPSAFFFIAFAPRLLRVIYPALAAEELRIAADLLRIVACNVIFLSAMQIYVSLLQALDKTGYAVLGLSLAIVVKTALSLVLTRFVGITGSAVASAAMSVIALVAVNVAYVRICGLHLEKNVVLNLTIGAIMALIGMATSHFIKNDVIATCVGFAACAAAYIWLVFLTGLIGKEEIEFLPMRRLMRRIRRVVRFWEYKDET